MKKAAIYTGTGDQGMTSLVGGVKVAKTHQRLEAYGTIDELNSFIGLLLTEIDDERIIGLLQWVQHKLCSIGSCLATGTGQTKIKSETRITTENILQLEQGIDLFDSELPDLKAFVLPGGCRSAALAHVCRTVCRRAEREIYRLNETIPVSREDSQDAEAKKQEMCTLNETIPVDENILVFINRLSDLLFVIARHESFEKKVEEICWNNICK